MSPLTTPTTLLVSLLPLWYMLDLPHLLPLSPHSIPISPPHLPTPPLSISPTIIMLWKKPYQHWRVSDEKQWSQMMLVLKFQMLEEQRDTWTAESKYQEALWEHGIQTIYNVLGCSDCWDRTNLDHCPKSRYHPEHPIHCCFKATTCPCYFNTFMYPI